MKAFVFALEPLLDVRDRAKRAAAATFASASRETALHRARAATLAAERAGIGRALAKRDVTSEWIGANFLRLESLAAEFARCESTLAHAREREALACDAYRRTRREHRRIALLRERALAAHEAERDAHEARALDEANAVRGASTSRASSFHI